MASPNATQQKFPEFQLIYDDETFSCKHGIAKKTQKKHYQEKHLQTTQVCVGFL